MSEQEQTLRHVLTDAMRSAEPASTPSFARLWATAHEQREQLPGMLSSWAETLTAGVAVASVIAMGFLIAANIREGGSGEGPDTALYSQLIAQTTWASPTDALLDSPARFPLAGLPALPAVNTNPSLESLL